MSLNIKGYFPIVQVFATLKTNYVIETQPPQDESNIFDPKRPVDKKKKKKNKEADAKRKLTIIS